MAPLAPMAPAAAGVVVTGPNHALHFILTLFTFWACGGWAWIWLLIALTNTRRVQAVDAYGHVIQPPSLSRKDTTVRAMVAIGAIFGVFILLAVINSVTDKGGHQPATSPTVTSTFRPPVTRGPWRMPSTVVPPPLTSVPTIPEPTTTTGR